MLNRRTILLASSSVALGGCATQLPEWMAPEGTNGRIEFDPLKGAPARRDAQGNVERLTADGWKKDALQSDATPETKIERLPTWDMQLQDGGIKAWLYVENRQSDKNYRYIDPTAPIVRVCNNSATGWASYLIKGNADKHDFVVKRANFTKEGSLPEVIGRLEDARGEWRFTPQGGPTIAAPFYSLTSKGIRLIRANQNAFSYFPSSTPFTRQLPEGWSFAWSQMGDYEKSRLLVLKRQVRVSMLDAPRWTIGYYDIDKSVILPTTFEVTMNRGLEPDLFRNGHYLYNTVRGPLVIARDKGIQHVVVMNMLTGQRKVAFEREAGISRIASRQVPTGRVYLTAQVGFSDEVIFDVEDFLYNDRRTPPGV